MIKTMNHTDWERLFFESNDIWPQNIDEGLIENAFSGAFFLGEANYRNIQLDNFVINFHDYNLKESVRSYIDVDYDIVEMNFSLAGQTDLFTTINSKMKSQVYGHHNILYGGQLKGYYDFLGPNHRSFKVHMRPSFFLKNLPEEYEVFKTIRRLVQAKQGGVITQLSYPITSSMYSVITAILGCQHKGVLKKMFLESKVMELLVLQLEQINTEGFKDAVPLNKKEIEKIYAVKEMLERDFKNIETLAKLAQMVGTNEFTLKKGFKTVFGTSVFNYWKRLRLQTAKVLLREKGLSVEETAFKIGYKNPQHFNRAFKNEFGISPGKLKESKPF